MLRDNRETGALQALIKALMEIDLELRSRDCLTTSNFSAAKLRFRTRMNDQGSKAILGGKSANAIGPEGKVEASMWFVELALDQRPRQVD
jgi:hypothetical protein